jgi:hypothetical protein
MLRTLYQKRKAAEKEMPDGRNSGRDDQTREAAGSAASSGSDAEIFLNL